VTSPRDEVDDWLGGEVLPLHPPTGALDQIRQRARRRKTRQTVFAAAGCAVVLAAAVTVPQLVSSGHRTGGSRPPVAGGLSPSSIQASTSRSAAGTEAPAATSSAPVQVQQRSRLSTITSGTVPPRDFQPTSVTFVGANDGTGNVVGAVIGQAGPPCATKDCTSLAGTANYGSSWYGVSAPLAPGPDGAAGISQLRFANLQDGWAFGPALYETSDGGWPWHQEKTYGQRVIDVEAAGTHAYAVFGSCTGSGPDYAATCTSFTLYTSVAGSRTWTPIAVPAGFAPMTSTAAPELVISGGATVNVLTPAGELLSGPLAGGTWTSVGKAPCAPAAAQATGQLTGAQLAAGHSLLWLTCESQASGGATQIVLYTSTDGASWQDAGPVSAAGTPASLASAAAGQAVLATSTGIYYSADGGKTWGSATFAGSAPAGGFSYVGMTNQSQGVAVPANPQLGEIFVTSDGGRSWIQSPISG
jgi:hypothetical protein